jgi:copper chaperone
VEKVLIGVRGLVAGEETDRVVAALKAVPGVVEASTSETGQVEVRYDGSQATVMDLIRAVRSQGFLAGML